MDKTRNQLLGALIGLGGTISQAMDEIEGFVPCGRPAGVVLGGLAACGDESATGEELARDTQTVIGFIEHVSSHRGVPAHDPRTEELSGEECQLAEGLVEFAGRVQGKELPADLNAFVYRALAALDACDARAVAAARARLTSVSAETDAL